jgi:hypothetical protein
MMMGLSMKTTNLHLVEDLHYSMKVESRIQAGYLQDESSTKSYSSSERVRKKDKEKMMARDICK